MSEVLTPIVTQLGIGAVGGFIVGYALKKVTKIVAVIIGLFLVALIYLVSKGIITVDYGKFEDAIFKALGGAGTATGWLAPIIAHLPFAGAFGLGFFLGFKMG
jgi:uncharacterized membrane protein (Fun14 family)